jgi:ankyrin repeat protein
MSKSYQEYKRGHSQYIPSSIKTTTVRDTLSATANIDLLITDKQPSNNWFNAVRNSDLTAMKILLAKDPKLLNAQDYLGHTAIMRAASKDIKIVKFLLEKNVEVNIFNKQNDSALMVAIRHKQDKIANLLIASKAKIPHKDKQGNSALTWAARANNTQMIDIILSADIDINDSLANGDTALIISTWKGHYETVQKLISHGANIDKQNYNGETALMLAIKRGHSQIIDLLISNRANIGLESNSKKTAIDFSVDGSLLKMRLIKMHAIMSDRADYTSKLRRIIKNYTVDKWPDAAREIFKLTNQQWLQQEIVSEMHYISKVNEAVNSAAPDSIISHPDILLVINQYTIPTGHTHHPIATRSPSSQVDITSIDNKTQGVMSENKS